MMRRMRQYRRTITHARDRGTSKNFVSASHHPSSLACNAASRFPLSSAYRLHEFHPASPAPAAAEPHINPQHVRNHKSSLTH